MSSATAMPVFEVADRHGLVCVAAPSLFDAIVDRAITFPVGTPCMVVQFGITVLAWDGVSLVKCHEQVDAREVLSAIFLGDRDGAWRGTTVDSDGTRWTYWND